MFGVPGQLGATAQNPAQYADCNIAAPSDTGKEIIKRLQALLQREIPNSGVLQTGFLDAETCAAWRDYTADKPWYRKYPGNFNITNILDTLDGASVDANGVIVHHWRCNGPVVSPDCTKVPGRKPETDPCPIGQERDATSGDCVPLPPCPPGEKRDETTGECVTLGPCPPGEKRDVASGDCVTIQCPNGQVLDLKTNQCAPIKVSKGKKKSDLGLLLLAGAVLAAAAYSLV